MAPRRDILIVGNICKDIIYSTESYPAEDRKVKALSKETRIGGNAGNIVQVLAQLNKDSQCNVQCNVHCCVKLGSCEYSQYTKSALQSLGVEVFAVVEENMDIPESVVIHSDTTSSRTCLHYRGNCNDLTCTEVLSVVGDLDKYQWVHLDHRRNGLEVLKLAREIKRVVPDITLSIDIEKIREGFQDMLAVVDYPIVSKEVCKTLGYDNLEAALKGLSVHCRHSVIVTWAEKGAGIWLKEGSKNLVFNNEKQIKIDEHSFICEAYKVDDIVDSIGAGDSFTAGFIYCASSLQKSKLPKSLQSACKVAASKLKHHGMNIDKGVLDF